MFVVLKQSLLAFADKILLLLDVHITYMQMEETSLAYISMILQVQVKGPALIDVVLSFPSEPSGF